MFLMSVETALATFGCIILLYIFIKSRKLNVNWGSSTQSQYFVNALKSVQSLNKIEDHVKNYRPKIIVLSGDPSHRYFFIFQYLIKNPSKFSNFFQTKFSRFWKSFNKGNIIDDVRQCHQE